MLLRNFIFPFPTRFFLKSQPFRTSLFSFLVNERSRECFLSNKISSQHCPGLRSLEQFNPRIVTIEENSKSNTFACCLLVCVCVLGIWINSPTHFTVTSCRVSLISYWSQRCFASSLQLCSSTVYSVHICTSRQDITLPMCARMLNIDQKLCCFHITFLDKTCFW